MKRVCREIQRALADDGPQMLQLDEAAREHVAQCDECFRFLEAAAEVEEGLRRLPALDAPEPVVESLLARVADEAPAGREQERNRVSRLADRVAEAWHAASGLLRSRNLQWAAASVFVVALLGLLTPRLMVRSKQPEVVYGLATQDETPVTEKLSEEQIEELKGLGYLRDGLAQTDPGAGRQDTAAQGNRREPSSRPQEFRRKQVQDRPAEPEPLKFKVPPPRSSVEADASSDTALLEESAQALRGEKEEQTTREIVPGEDRDRWNELLARAGEGTADAEPRAPAGGDESGQLVFAHDHDLEGDELLGGFDDAKLEAREAARLFLEQRRETNGLVFQAATGYWSNTYIPGDRALRLLDARLRQQDRLTLQKFATQALRLHDGAEQTAQPFDPPGNAALAVYLHADRAGLPGKGRLIVQVGLQATPRHAGRRGAMNVGVVLDLRHELDESAAIALRSLVAALGEARDVGDRFHLVVAGRTGVAVVEPEDFRHGPLLVAMDRLLTSQPAGPDSSLDLQEALAQAIERVGIAGDPHAPLGSSVVLLATSQPLGAVTPELAGLAHVSAVAGVPVSVVGVGTRVDGRELDRVALAGQGNRRLLEQPAEAAALVDRELSAVSRVVARALRLRIRLAPGVELIDVVGSERLTAARAERVREAEQSIDRRLARNLGIEADRGEDEDGIQIVIPSFQAGDAHAVLLDVVTAEPGPIADVTLRYKDLLYLRNGVARAQLSLDREELPAGALEINVLKNLLAVRLHGRLDAASRALSAGDAATARQLLRNTMALLEGLRRELPGLQRDRNMQIDIALLSEYISLLDAGAHQAPAERQLLADSMRYAGWLKVLPRPTAELEAASSERPAQSPAAPQNEHGSPRG